MHFTVNDFEQKLLDYVRAYPSEKIQSALQAISEGRRVDTGFSLPYEKDISDLQYNLAYAIACAYVEYGERKALFLLGGLADCSLPAYGFCLECIGAMDSQEIFLLDLLEEEARMANEYYRYHLLPDERLNLEAKVKENTFICNMEE